MFLSIDQDMWINVFGVMAALTVVMPATKRFVLTPLSNRCLGPPLARKKTKQARALEAKREKFLNTAWKFVNYTFFFLFGVWAIQNEHYWFWDPYSYKDPYPNGNAVPSRILKLYALETGYYLFSTVAVFFEPKMKDRTQMFVHHLFTSFLLLSSYAGSTTRFGVPIMLLHDIADPFMEVAKLFLYCGNEMMANLFFILFTGVFIFFRDWLFPRHIIWPIIEMGRSNYYKYYYPTVGSLVGLWVLHLIWTYMIFQVIKRSMTGKIGDVREEDEFDELSEKE